MAQAAHAGQMFQEFMDNAAKPVIPGQVDVWSRQKLEFNGTRSFGTTIVLALPCDEDIPMPSVRELAQSTCSDLRHIEAQERRDDNVVPAAAYALGIVNDPTYPVKDGLVTHYVELDTCFWVFIPDGWFKPSTIYDLELYT